MCLVLVLPKLPTTASTVGVDLAQLLRGETEVVPADPRLRRLGDDIGSNQEDLAQARDQPGCDEHEHDGDDRVQRHDPQRDTGREDDRQETTGDEQPAHARGHHERSLR